MKGSPQYHDPQGERGNHQYLTPQERKRLRPALALGMKNECGHLLAEHTHIRLAVCVIAIVRHSLGIQEPTLATFMNCRSVVSPRCMRAQ